MVIDGCSEDVPTTGTAKDRSGYDSSEAILLMEESIGGESIGGGSIGGGGGVIIVVTMTEDLLRMDVSITRANGHEGVG